ncbi:MAG: hypothetical protein LBK63_01710 [Treponema sp.]|jgi:hypothetical protein|nr:hypothetical protein [Treponema sp.]
MNNLSVATVVSSLMGEIFDMSQAVFDTLEANWRGWEEAQYDFSRSGSTRYVSGGSWTLDFRNKLNYSAMVTDYGLADLFAGLLAATTAVQSAGINLSSRGAVSISGQYLVSMFSQNKEAVATPSLAVQEAINIGEMIAFTAELGKLGVNIVSGITARVNAAEEKPKLEAL